MAHSPFEVCWALRGSSGVVLQPLTGLAQSSTNHLADLEYGWQLHMSSVTSMRSVPWIESIYKDHLADLECGWQFLRLGVRGYKKIMGNLMTVTKRLQEGILETGESHLATSPEQLKCLSSCCCTQPDHVSQLQSLTGLQLRS